MMMKSHTSTLNHPHQTLRSTHPLDGDDGPLGERLDVDKTQLEGEPWIQILRQRTTNLPTTTVNLSKTTDNFQPTNC